LANWSLVTRGLHGSFASPFVKYPKNSIPSIKPQQTCHLTGWKGERVYGQMVFWSADSIADIELAISDFVSSEGKKMPATIAKTQVVKYVLTDEFGGGCDTRKPGDFTVSLSPDVLDNSSSVTLTPKTSRPVWISIDIPENAGAFRYQSKLIVKTKNQISKEFDISLEVVNKTLPKPADWKFYLDLWQNPYSVARYYRVKLWSKEHWSLLTPLMKMLADAGQKTITVSINKRPWGTQTEDPYESMIGWTKKTDGTWEYDYSIFDQWVNFMMALGIKKQINCYSLVPWGNEFYYFDQKSKNEVKLKAEPGSKPYSELLIPFLTDFRGHLQKKGWNKITCLAMDERAPEEMKAMLSLVSAIAPEFGISLADNHKSYKLYPDQLKDLSVAFGAIIEEKDLTYRKANNMVSTFYLCCTNEFPNNFTFSPPSEGIYIGWYAMAANLDGFLRWSFNNWVANPLTDSRFRTWPAGDTYIVYPGARSSVRFEMLRDGIEDAEKIRILRDQFTTQNRTDELKKLNQLVGQFNQTKKPANTDEMIFNAQSRLNELSKNN
jgi:serine protease inhibitor ecotin